MAQQKSFQERLHGIERKNKQPPIAAPAATRRGKAVSHRDGARSTGGLLKFTLMFGGVLTLVVGGYIYIEFNRMVLNPPHNVNVAAASADSR